MISYSSTNCLLVKADIGQVKPATHMLPAGEYSYGRKVAADQFDAGKLLSSWNYYQTNSSPSLERDFRKINKIVLKEKVNGRRQIQKLMASVDIKLKPKYEHRPQVKQLLRDRSCELTTYGKPSDTLNSFKVLINGTIGNQTEQKFLQKAQDLIAAKKAQSVRKVKETKASQMQSFRFRENEVKNLSFKIHRFSQIQPKVVTRRLSPIIIQ